MQAEDRFGIETVYKGYAVHSDRILAKVAVGSTASAHAHVLAANGVSATRGFTVLPGWIVIEAEEANASVVAQQAGAAYDPSGDRQDAATRLHERITNLRASGLYEFVEPDYLVRAAATPTDARFVDGTLWGLRNSGQDGGVAGVDIDAVRAWDVTTGSSAVVVAVIDSGIRTTHNDLEARLWRNPGEVAGNGRDDDGNGYVDDIFGINAITSTGNPSDDDGHGTHVAGTIGAAANDGHPHVGVAWNVRLMALKFLDAEGVGTTSEAIQCIDYAIAKGARIINASWGNDRYSRAMFEAIREAERQGVLVVAAAGNEGRWIDGSAAYPAGFATRNIISVAAHDRTGALAVFSNRGSYNVHLAAPGVDILSTFNRSNNDYQTGDGTSVATPHVTGVAALVLSRFPDISMGDLRARLVQTVTPVPALAGLVASGGRLNAYNALTATGDGQLELAVFPVRGTTQYHARQVPVVLRVSDLEGVTGATVTGTPLGGSPIAFLDDGVAADQAANDALYTALVTMPAGGSSITIQFNASAPGKSGGNTEVGYRLVAAAPNDAFSSRTDLGTSAASITATNLGASSEPGEPAHAGQPAAASVWWQWTAPGSGVVKIDTLGSAIDTVLAVYAGETLGALTPVASNDDFNAYNLYSEVEFPVTSGTVYQIAVDGFEGVEGTIRLRLTPRIPPPNDGFANAVALTGEPLLVHGTTRFATAEPGEPAHRDLPAGVPSAWWKWTAPRTGTALIDVSGGPTLAIYRGTALGALQVVPIHSGSSYDAEAFGVEAGAEYSLAFAGSEADFSFSLSIVDGPPNDRFADRIVLSGEAPTASGNLRWSTREVGEAVVRFEAGPLGGGTIWWTWTAPFSGVVILDASRPQSISPGLSVHTGDSVDTLTPIAAQFGKGLDSKSTRLTFAATMGTTYHLAVHGSSSGVNQVVNLSLRLYSAAPNDAFADRIVLEGETAQASGFNYGATREPGEAAFAVNAAGATVWWSWTAPRAGTLVVSGSFGGPFVRVYTGSAVSALTLQPNSYNSYAAFLPYLFRVEPGTTYHIGLDTSPNYIGPVSFTLSLHDPPANDEFADRAALSGASVSVTGLPTYATRDPGDLHDSGLAGSLWWNWTAPRSGMVLVSTHSAAANVPRIGVYSGSSVSTLVPVPEIFGVPQRQGTRFAFHAVEGQTYQLVAAGDPTSTETFELRVLMVDAPANDAFASRIALTGEKLRATGDTLGATPETGDPIANARTIWWSWTAPADGAVRVSIANSVPSAVVYGYSGTALGSLTLLGQSSAYTYDRVPLLFRTTAGTTYTFMVASDSSSAGEVVLDLDFFRPPANDAFASPSILSGESVDVTSFTYGATAEPGEAAVILPFAPTATVWWSWTAPRDGTARVELSDRTQLLRMRVFTGESIATLIPVIDSQPTQSDVRKLFHARAGQTYRIVVTPVSSNPDGDFALSVHLADGPPNDMFADRIQLEGSDAEISGDTVLSTREEGEMAPGFHQSLWWTWTAPRNGRLVVSLDSAFVRVAVLSGATLDGLVRQPSPTVSRQAAVDVTSGSTYQIAVGSLEYGYDPAIPTSFSGRVFLVDPPANDNFADRIPIAGDSVRVTANNYGATTQPGDGTVGVYSAAATVWWTWMAPASGRVIASVEAGALFHPSLGVFTGSVQGALTHVPVPQFWQGPLMFDATAGSVYQIAVGGVLGSMGDFTLKLNRHEPPSNDHFANAITLTGERISTEGTNLAASTETGEPNHLSAFASATTWWRWMAPRSGRVVVRVDASEFSPVTSIYTGLSLANLSQVTSGLAGVSGEGKVFVTFDAVVNTVYHVAVDGMSSRMGPFTVSLDMVDPPANDLREDATALSGAPVFVAGSNFGATTVASEFVNQPGIYGAGVWWRWLVPETGRFVVSMPGIKFRHAVALFDSAAGTLALPVQSMTGTPASPARIVFDAVGGAEYLILVAGNYGAMGDIPLRIEAAAPPVATARRITLAPVAGRPFELHADVSGPGPFTYQWLFRGRAIPGATQQTYVMPAAQEFQCDGFSVRVTSEFGSTESATISVPIAPAGPSTARLLNLSTRARGQAGESAIIPGLVVEGGNKRILVRAVGPQLDTFGVANHMPDPRMTVKRLVDGVFVDHASNENWGTALEVARVRSIANTVGAFPLDDDSLDAALLVDLPPGTFTVVADDAGGSSGIAIVEVYDASEPGTGGSFVNLSNRGYVGTGGDVMIPGFVVSPGEPRRFLLRAIGPTLTEYGVSGVLTDPKLALFRSNPQTGASESLFENDNWGEFDDAVSVASVAEQVGAFPLPVGSKDASLVVTLPAGVYTAHASGANGETGVALVEIYMVP